MQDEGFSLLWRKAFSHEFWTEKRSFSRWEAWEDLWANQAAFAEHKKFIGSQSILLDRGQLVASERFLAKRWRWSVGKVRRYLAYLDEHGMMRRERAVNAGRTETDSGNGSVYTVVTYKLHQDLQLAIAAATKRQRSGNEAKRIKEVKKDSPNGESVEPFSNRASEIWRDRMGGTAPRVRINVALRPLVVEHGAAEVLKWWDKYLANPKTGAQFKNPNDFASRFGAWIAEQSRNGCSVEDIRRCLHIGGSMLSMQVSRESAFETIREAEPALWERVKDVLPRFDFPYLLSLGSKNGFELDRAIKSRLESHD